MTMVILYPIALLLISEAGGNGRSARTIWHWVMYVAMVLGVLFDLLTLLPRDQSAGDPIALARHAMVVAHQNIVLSFIAVFFGVISFGIFLLKLRRTAG